MPGQRFEIHRLWGLLWVVPASMEYHGVYAGLKKANIYAPMILGDTCLKRSAKPIFIGSTTL